jgi:tRNA-2-methylthio-N6-dimethylallyladenosine synthase
MAHLDGRILASELVGAGWKETSSSEKADAIFLFTCSVRSKPEEKVFSRLGQLRALKKANPRLVLGVLGCMAERLGHAVIKRAPHVDVVAGSGAFLEVVRLLAQGDFPRPAVLTGFEDTMRFHRRPALRRSPFQAFVSIMRGCEKFCSYCVVPYVRGPERSRPAQEILDEVRRLVEDGVVEITLLGQSIAAYGRDIGESFPDLLRQVCALPGLVRVRFLTSHPADFHEDILPVFGENPLLCPHLQMPAQSGSDPVLGRMKRGYTVGRYREIIETVRARVPAMEITSDFIVGFPGETEDDHARTLALIEWAGFRNVFVFKYVPRPGTRAADFTDDVPPETKQSRLLDVLKLQRHVGERRNLEMVGDTVSVLVEGPSARDVSRWTGRTAGNHIVVFPGPDRSGRQGRFRIASTTALTLLGEPL